MDYFSNNSVVIITKDYKIKKVFRSISPKFPNSSFKIFSSQECVKENRFVKIIFFDRKYQESNNQVIKNFEFLKSNFEIYSNIPIVLISDICTFKEAKELLGVGIESIVYKPINSNLLEILLFKHLTKLKDSVNIIKYHGIILYPKLRTAFYNNCKIFLTDIESTILSMLLHQNSDTTNNYYSLNNLSDRIKQDLGYDISDTYLRVSISRIRSKFEKVSGLNIIKNRYSRGYYISI